jgi:hypothetical protein
VEVVLRAIEVGWHGGDGVEAVLDAVRLAHLDAGDLGDGVPLVGGLERRDPSGMGCGANLG